MIQIVLWVILAHYIADYPLQGDFLAQTKGKYFYSLLAHSLIYSLIIMIPLTMMGKPELWRLLVILFSHMIIDYKKATAKNKDKALTTYLYIDQALHISINLLLAFI